MPRLLKPSEYNAIRLANKVGSSNFDKYFVRQGKDIYLKDGVNTNLVDNIPSSAPTAQPSPTVAAPAPKPESTTVANIQSQAAPNPATVPGAVPAGTDPLSRTYQESIGNTYLGTMEAVTAAKQAGKNVEKVGNSYYVVNNPGFQQNTPQQGGDLSRAALTARGYQYLGTMDAVAAAKKGGEDVQMLGGSYYIAPKKLVGSAPDTTTQTPTTGTTAPDTAFGEWMKQLPPSIQTMLTQAPPEAKSMVDEYTALRNSENISTLEQSVNDATAALNNLDAAYLAGKHNVNGTLAPMSIISGDQQKLADQYNEQRTIAVNELNAKTQILAQKNALIETMMNLTQTDYTNARQAYQDSFSNAMNVQQAFRSAYESDRTYENMVAQQKQDDARSNLSVISNAITTSGQNWNDLSAGMKTQIQKLEMQAGIPTGTIQTLVTSKPGTKLLSTVNGTDANGNDIVSFIYADANGNPGIVKTVRTGGKSKSVSDTTAEDQAKIVADFKTDLLNPTKVGIKQQIATVGQEKGSPEDYVTREQLIAKLQSKWGDRIDPQDIATSVYQAYP